MTEWWNDVQEKEALLLKEELDYRKKYESFLMSVARSGESWEGTFDDFLSRQPHG